MSEGLRKALERIANPPCPGEFPGVEALCARHIAKTALKEDHMNRVSVTPERVQATPERIQVLSVFHRKGENISLHRTLAGARAELYRYVKRYWHTQSDYGDAPTDCPKDPERAIGIYFDDNPHDEYYMLTEAEIQD